MALERRSSRLETFAFVLIAITSAVTADAVVYRTSLAGPPVRAARAECPAAHAAECAHDQGRFAAFLDVVYAQQDSLGLVSWSEFAALAEVPDMARFEGCLSSEESPDRIELGLGAGRRIGVRGTPTILINDWRVSPRSSAEEFSRQIEDASRRTGSSLP